MTSSEERDTYKYRLVEQGKTIYYGVTYDFSRRAVEHRKDFPNATIKQVGRKVTRVEAMKWWYKQKPNRTSLVRTVGMI